MVTRTRSTEARGAPGYRYSNGVLTSTSSAQTKYDYIRDEVVVGNDRDLLVRHYRQIGVPHFTGSWSSGGTDYEMLSYPFPTLGPSIDSGIAHLTIAGRPSDNALATRMLAMTNPSRPHVDIPLFIFELKDIPKLMQQRSNDVGKDIASKRVGYEFGIAPLIRDIRSMLDFPVAVEARKKEIAALRKSGLRRKRRLWEGTRTASTNNNIVNGNIGWFVYYNQTSITLRKTWGYVEWKPSGTLFGPPSDDFGKTLEAISASASLYPNLESLWNAIPYSWLADWYGNIGPYLAANRNFVGHTPGPVLIMDEYKTEQSVTGRHSGPAASKLSVSPGFTWKRHLVSKVRTRISSPSLEAHMPFLSERQVMILSDLGRGITNHIRKRSR